MLGLAMFMSSCTKEVELIPKLEGIPGGGVLDAEIKSVNGNTVNFRADLFAVNHYGDFIEELDGNCFSSPNDDLELTQIQIGEPEDKGPYSVMLLFDQSGSIRTTDPQNARIEAGKAFVDIIGDGDEAGVSVFAQGSSNYTSPFEILQGLTSDKDALKIPIEDMRNKADGFTPLYFSIWKLVEYMLDNAKNDNRAIIVFTDGEDTEGGVLIQTLIDDARQAGVEIYTVGLTTAVNLSVLTDIALGTGGAVMLAQDALQLIALYSSLSDLLHGDGTFYETCWQAKKPNGSPWVSGESVVTTIQLTLPTGELVDFPIRLTIP